MKCASIAIVSLSTFVRIAYIDIHCLRQRRPAHDPRLEIVSNGRYRVLILGYLNFENGYSLRKSQGKIATPFVHGNDGDCEILQCGQNLQT